MNAQVGTKIELHDLRRTVDSGATELNAEASPRKLARIAGGLYLINIVGGFFAIGFVPAAIMAAGNAAATAHNLMTHEQLFRLGLVAHMITLVTNIPLAVIFYDLFKVVNRRLSRLVVFFLLVGTAIEGANLFNQFAPLILLGGGRYLSVFNAEQLQALAYISLDLQKVSYNLNAVFFGFYCLTIGYLVFRSAFLPRILGVLLALGGMCYLTYSFADFIAPAFAASLVPYIQMPSGIAELALSLWFLVIGVNVQRWREQAVSGAGQTEAPGLA